MPPPPPHPTRSEEAIFCLRPVAGSNNDTHLTFSYRCTTGHRLKPRRRDHPHRHEENTQTRETIGWCCYGNG